MSIEPSNPLINIGDLAKPAVVLIEKISDAVGWYYAPAQIKRIAKAEAEAARIKAKSAIQITELEKRAARRLFEEEVKHQKNMESITAQALPLLNDDADPSAMENDWLANFFDKSRIVTDNQMQALWARILAGEANAPGAVSRRTVNLLADFDKEIAETFERLCGFVWEIETDFKTESVPLVFDGNAAIYRRHGINFDTLNNLDSIGVLKLHPSPLNLSFHPVSTSPDPKLPKRCIARYHDRQFVLDLSKVSNFGIPTGRTLLTNTGKELARICGGKPVDGFYEYVKEQWTPYLAEVDTNNEDKIGAGYAILDEFVGSVESGSPDGSVNHDDLILEFVPRPPWRGAVLS